MREKQMFCFSGKLRQHVTFSRNHNILFMFNKNMLEKLLICLLD